MKKQLINETDGSMCIETKNIEHNNYIIDNNSLQNTLPVDGRQKSPRQALNLRGDFY